MMRWMKYVLGVCLCGAMMATSVNASAATVAAKLHALENNKAIQVERMLANRGYRLESIELIMLNGRSVFNVNARRNGQRVNFKILESSLQIISETRQ